LREDIELKFPILRKEEIEGRVFFEFHLPISINPVNTLFESSKLISA